MKFMGDDGAAAESLTDPEPVVETTNAVSPAKKGGRKSPKKVKAKKVKASNKTPKAKAKAAKGAKKPAKAKSTNRGPKGWAAKDRVRHGVAADVEFGQRIAKARKVKGWPQHELARRCGITQPAMCNIEKATSGAGPEVAAKIAKVLGIKPLGEHPARRPPAKKGAKKAAKKGKA